MNIKKKKGCRKSQELKWCIFSLLNTKEGNNRGFNFTPIKLLGDKNVIILSYEKFKYKIAPILKSSQSSTRGRKPGINSKEKSFVDQVVGGLRKFFFVKTGPVGNEEFIVIFSPFLQPESNEDDISKITQISNIDNPLRDISLKLIIDEWLLKQNLGLKS